MKLFSQAVVVFFLLTSMLCGQTINPNPMPPAPLGTQQGATNTAQGVLACAVQTDFTNEDIWPEPEAGFCEIAFFYHLGRDCTFANTTPNEKFGLLLQEIDWDAPIPLWQTIYTREVDTYFGTYVTLFTSQWEVFPVTVGSDETRYFRAVISRWDETQDAPDLNSTITDSRTLLIHRNTQGAFTISWED